MEGGGGRSYCKSTLKYGNVNIFDGRIDVGGGGGRIANQLSHMALLTYLMDG